MPITKSGFKPAWWLPGPHLQTLWATFFRRRPDVTLNKQRLELPDGDFLDLAISKLDTRPIVVVLHGLEGSLNSHYIRPLIKRLDEAGYGVCFMYFRGCSGEPNRLPRSYHSGETQDLQFVIECLNNKYPQQVFAVIGFSLGANVLLKWLGEQEKQAAIKTAIAISVPFQLAHAANRLEHSFSRLYQKYLVSKCQKKYKQKFATQASPLGPEMQQNIAKLNTFYAFDDQITAPLHGFKGVEDYYRRSSCRQYLKNIQVPTLILHARDDPFMWSYSIPDEQELSPAVNLELSESGGHVGFISGNVPFRAEYWLDKRILKWLQQYSGRNE